MPKFEKVFPTMIYKGMSSIDGTNVKEGDGQLIFANTGRLKIM
jgi:hypothetical protein